MLEKMVVGVVGILALILLWILVQRWVRRSRGRPEDCDVLTGSCCGSRGPCAKSRKEE